VKARHLAAARTKWDGLMQQWRAKATPAGAAEKAAKAAA